MNITHGKGPFGLLLFVKCVQEPLIVRVIIRAAPEHQSWCDASEAAFTLPVSFSLGFGVIWSNFLQTVLR
jgi:hypothetical protein